MTRYIVFGLSVALILAFWRLDHISTSLDASSQRVRDLESQAEAHQQAITVRDSIDSQFQEEIRNAEDSKPQLVADLNSGARVVYVRAACMPTNPNPTGSTDAAAPQLAADARQDYADLVAANRKVTAQVAGLQQFILSACVRAASK
ncbi:prophage endopeptidase [Pseudomonas saponiphila]|uniref:Prophage endopeptidase n=1 Tax=Pseudomonas saponiphila TaxID=556534 RepID=A0A1H4LQU8_9PSED|nr:lysis system i-spanin subunit Rz [Pseudomonas saponiphila]SEB73011.1 prophage endopeptidase [Pseudomonas saponiphila]